MPACAQCGEDNPARARFCLGCGARLAAPEPQAATRRTVTVLFCDVVDSTPLGERLDAETFRRVQSRYFDVVRAALERHGGTVEKFIGDAVMAVFGIPTLHEDDALRAVRAAAELREAVAPLDEELARDHGLRLRLRVGVATGEVVAGDPADAQSFATGETLVVAERLERAAQPSEVLVADSTYRLVADASIVEPVDPVPAKGKAEPVAAWRLVGVQTDGPGVARRLDTPLVGREFELDQLRAAFDEAVSARRVQLATVIGPAGIGKSRLVTELCASVADGATTVSGRCLPYGDGITFWPLELILHAAGGPDAVREVLHGEEDGEVVASQLLAAIGEAPSRGQETFWAVRRFLEALARPRPLIVVFEDLHWAEPTFLDLVEYLVAWCRDAPILIVCTARPELMERRAGWLDPRRGSLAITVEPLSNDDADRLVDALRGESELPEETRARIAAAAEGNPLFVEQMVAMAAESGAAVAIPPTLQALLAARLDRLPAGERSVLERAAAIGREFSRRAVVELSPPEEQAVVGAVLLTLTRKELIRPSAHAGREEAYRFRHILIRDAAYERIPKETRAQLHERFATWLGASGGEDAIVGYHLEQAFRYREQLGPPPTELAARASASLGRAGRRAFAVNDVHGAITLLARAAELAEAPDRAALLTQLASAHLKVGRFTDALETVDAAVAAARETGDRVAELRAIVERQIARVFTAGESTVDDDAEVARAVIPELQRLGDHLGLAKAWRLLSDAHAAACRWGDRADALERALAHARSVPEGAQEAAATTTLLAQALYYGATPVPDALARVEELVAESATDPALRAGLQAVLAALRAAVGDFEGARALYASSVAVDEELGLALRRAVRALLGAEVELAAGNVVGAEHLLRKSYDTLDAMGESGVRAVVAAYLANVVTAQARHEEALQLAETATTASPADLVPHVLARTARAHVLAARGDLEGGERAAREAVDLARPTDFVALQAQALVALAHVLSAAAREPEARAAYTEAHELYTRKGNVALAGRVEAALGAPVA